MRNEAIETEKAIEAGVRAMVFQGVLNAMDDLVEGKSNRSTSNAINNDANEKEFITKNDAFR